MKKLLLVLSLIFNIYTLRAQTNKNIEIFGYTQTVSRGAFPGSIADEAGNSKTGHVKAGRNYFIYITLPASSRIYPVEMWLSGEQYSVKAEMISKTPVQIADPALPNGPGVITLVPKTSKKVMMLIPGNSNISGKSLASAKSKAKTNELVIVYKMSGKLYYALLKELNVLEGASMQ